MNRELELPPGMRARIDIHLMPGPDERLHIVP